MWHCFLTGSPKDPNGKQMLKVVHSVEYLTYDLKGKLIRVLGDFFIENVSDEPACLRGIHRGNIEFKAKTNSWRTDKYWTPMLMKIAGEYMGLDLNGENISLSRAGSESLKVSLLKDPFRINEEWLPPRPKNGTYTLFSGWETPLIEPEQCCLFRIEGVIQGKTYTQLMGEGEVDRIQIMGGKPLEEMILNDIRNQNVQTSEYDKFIEKYLDKPKYYHVFFELVGGRKVKVKDISQDMRMKVFNQEEDGRCISWCCSETDFNIFAGANGPVLVLSAI